MWFMEDFAKKENVFSPEERCKLHQQNEMLRKEKERIFMENDQLKVQQRAMRKDMDDLQKKYMSKRDSKFFLEFANEDLKNEYSELQKELRNTGRKLVQASRDLNMEKAGKEKLQRQLTHKHVLHSLEIGKLDSKLRTEKGKTCRMERALQIAENESRNVQQALCSKHEEVKKLLKEKKELFEVLKRHGINLYEGHTDGM